MGRPLRTSRRWLLPAGLVAGGIAFYWLLASKTALPTVYTRKEGVAAVLAAGGACILGVWAVRMYPTRAGIVAYALITGMVAGLLGARGDIMILGWQVTGNDILLPEWLHRTVWDRYIISVSLCLSASLIGAVSRRLREMELRFKKNARAEVLLRDAELFKLRQQLQPHFLYNSLNAISALILIDPDKAQEMTGRLSDFLRASVRREVQDLLPVADEINYLKTYLAIEAIRFGDRLQVVFEQEATGEARMPPFLLQPVIENAVKFGLYGRTGAVRITVAITLQDALLQIVVINPYDATLKPPSGTGFGLEGISRRLYLLYGRQDLIETKAENEHFTTIIKIPQPYAPGNPH